jgi:hypothetical protein
MDDTEQTTAGPTRNATPALRAFDGALDETAGQAGADRTDNPRRTGLPYLRGRQREIVGLPCIGTSGGMTTAAIAASIVDDDENVFGTLQELAMLDVVECVDNGQGSPRWRLVARDRG